MNRSGVTIMEVLVATGLISLVFLGATVMYVSSQKVFVGMSKKEHEISGFLAVEHMARRIGLGNEAVVTPSGDQVKVRWDYADYDTPLGTPADGTPHDAADDTWIKYRIIGESLRFRIDPAGTGDVSASDPEVMAGLKVLPASAFSFTPPHIVGIRLVTESGDPAESKTVRTGVILQGRGQR